MEERQYCLKWNNFQSTIATALEGCYTKKEFVDVTICAEGRSIKAHRVLLSACSPYFRSVFVSLETRDHPVIFLRDTAFADLLALINFIYHGEVCVIQERLTALFKLAQNLEIKGLATDRTDEINGSTNGSPDGNVIDCMDMLERLSAVKASEMTIPEASPVSSVPTDSLPHLDLPSHMRPMSPIIHDRRVSPISHRSHMSPVSRSRMSPISNRSHNMSPISNRSRNISPISNRSRNISPISNRSRHMSPNNNRSRRMSPSSNRSRHLSPGSNRKRGSPPSKKRKILNSPHVRQLMADNVSPGGSPNHAPVITPGHTPPDHTPPRSNSVPNTSRETLRLLQCTPPHPLHHQVTPSSSSSHSEEDSRVVNLSVNNGSSSPGRVYPKLEYDDVPANESGRDSEVEGNDRPLHGIPGDECDINSTCHELPLLSRLSLQRYDPYASHLDLAGPSRMLSAANPAAWRSSVSLSEPPEPQGSHPVFNELFGEGASCGGKKAVPTPCPVCRKVLSNAYNMRVHMETHQDITYKCIVCGIVTRTKDTMRKHCSNVHQLRNVEFKKSFKIISGKTGSPSSLLVKSPGDKSTTKKRFNPFGPLANLGGLLTPKGEQLTPKGEQLTPKKELLTPKKEPILTHPTITSSEGSEAVNLAKGSSLASIVSKLSQKQ